jgi:diguanylate cyclase (GGDEF)-like protein/PAS domain S-box-containing protein
VEKSRLRTLDWRRASRQLRGALTQVNGTARPDLPGVVDADLKTALSALADAHAELARRQSFTDALLETVEVGIVSCDAQGVFMVSNRAERTMFGLQSGLTGLLPAQLASLIDVFDSDGNQLSVDAYPLMRTLRGEDVTPVAVLVGPTGGPYREVVVRGSRIFSPEGELLGAVAALTDVTVERTAARALTEERGRLAIAEKAALRAGAFLNAVLSATLDYTFVTDLASGATIYGSRDEDVLGITGEPLEALGPSTAAAVVHPDDQLRLDEVSAAAADLGDGQVLQIRYRGQLADGTWHWINRRVTPFRRDSSGAVVEILGVLRDVTDLVLAEERLTYAALHDALTGLPNRALLVERLDAALTRPGRDVREVAVLFCDLDGFKNVNDTGGHAAGNAVLLEVARRLTSVLRDDDTVARVGGDEFVIIVEPWSRTNHVPQQHAHEAGDERHRTLAVHVAQRVAVALRRPITVDGVDHLVTASIGITYAKRSSSGHPDGITADEMLQNADAAMYRAKDRGKDCYELFDYGPISRNPVDVVG